MNERDLQPAHKLAAFYGVKSLVFGPPGSGKTPVINTAPNPVLLAVEPGMLSMRTSNVPTYEASTWAKIEEFFKWLHGSNESKKYHTLGVDSVSQMCEIYLRDNPKKVSHGLKLYGLMAEEVGDELHKLYFMREKHMYLICKQEIEQTADGPGKKRPYFPGKELATKVPHLYDLIMQLDTHSIPGYGAARAFHCHSAMDANVRDRSGVLAEFEEPNLSGVFNKIMRPIS